MLRNPDPLIPPNEAAEYLNCRPQTLAQARSERVGAFADIAYVKAGSRVLYQQSELDRWIAARTVRPAALAEASADAMIENENTEGPSGK